MPTHLDRFNREATLPCTRSAVQFPQHRRRKVRRSSPLVHALCIIALAACMDSTTTPTSNAPSATRVQENDASADRSAHTPLSGGAMTVFDVSAEAFGHPAPNLTAAELVRHNQGDGLFSAAFSAVRGAANHGLGPVFENTSCESCHLGDGRGRPPLPGELFSTMLFRASIPGRAAHNAPSPVPGFGTQIELNAIAGYMPLVAAAVQYSDSNGRFGDGTTYQLHVPHYSFSGAYRAMPANMLVSPRVTPVNFGVGLLDAVPEAEIRWNERQGNTRDGVRGHANVVWNAIEGGTPLVASDGRRTCRRCCSRWRARSTATWE